MILRFLAISFIPLVFWYFLGASQQDPMQARNITSEDASPRYSSWDKVERLKVAIIFGTDSRRISDDDPGYLGYEKIKHWLAQDHERSFLNHTNITPLSQRSYIKGTVITGQGQRFGSPQSQMPYKFTISVGGRYDLGKTIGKAIAQNHITIINTHFDYSDYDDYLDNHDSKIYEPLFENLEDGLDNTRIGYRMVVMNSCRSFELKDQLINAFKKSDNARHLAFIGHEGYNNFGFFAGQTYQLLTNLQRHNNWNTIIKGFQPPVNVPGYSYSQNPVQAKVVTHTHK